MLEELPTDRFSPHPLSWNPEKVQRLWDFYASDQNSHSSYFSDQFGEPIIQFVEKYVSLHQRRVLDYGCGPGLLLKHLLKRDVFCLGADSSRSSVEEVERAMGSHPRFLGAAQITGFPLRFADSSVDLVLMVEVIEHILDDEIEPTLHEVHRLLDKSGNIVITTPHAERLRENTLMCPDCGAMFHRWQHVRAFDERSLAALMTAHGFETIACRSIRFGTQMMLRNLPVLQRGKQLLRRFLRRPYEPLNLVYVGRKA